MKNNLLMILVSALIFFGCQGTGRQEAGSRDPVTKRQPVNIPDFNADSAYLYVKQQVDFGPRVPGSKAHAECAEYFVEKLTPLADTVIVQRGQVRTFDGTILNIKNIIASFDPGKNNRIFLCAHWDSRPYADFDADPKNHYKPIDGANDGASGAGVLLEIARHIRKERPAIGIDIILFDAEDSGPPEEKRIADDSGDWWGLGSQFWSRNQHVNNYFAKYGILLDMVGAPGATFLKEGFSMEYAPNVVDNVWRTANRIGYSSYFLFEQGTYTIDDHYYINKIAKIPTIDIIHLDRSTKSGFNHTWHTLQDNMENIDRNTLKAVGQTVLTVIYEEE